MEGKIILLLLFLLCIYPFDAQALNNNSISNAVENVIHFDARNAIVLTHASLIDRNSNRTLPFQSLGIYEEDHTISGTFLGPSTLAGTIVRATISRFDILKFMSLLDNNGIKPKGNGSPIRLNASGDASFSHAGLPEGVYMISIADEFNSTLLSASPLLVSKGEMSIEAPGNLSAGDPISMKVKTAGGEENKIYVAILISKKDYDGAKLEISTNNTTEGLLTFMALGNESRQIQGLPSMSIPFFMSMLPILPLNSAIAMQESKETEAKLILLTDKTWPKGCYILTCSVYAPGKGILGIRQEAIEVM
jgi:hypothetical protein